MKTVVVVVIILLTVVGTIVFSPMINDSIKEGQKIEEAKKSAQKADEAKKGEETKPENKNQGEESPSTLGRVFTFAVLSGILAWIIIMAYKEKRGPLNGPIQWKDILAQAVFYAIAGVVILNALANLFIYPAWRWFFNHQTLFWGVNMALVIFAHFTTKKEPYAKWIAVGTAFLIFLGFVNVFRTEYKNKKNENNTASFKASFGNVPVEVAKKVICECESGCQQFEVDKEGKFVTGTDGKKIPYKNRGIPEKDIPPSTAFGKYQFLEVHREPAKKLGYDLNTEEGQEKYFEYLYGKEGFGPWDHDQKYGGGSVCWGPKLAKLGYEAEKSQLTIQIIEAPINDWGRLISLPYNSRKTSLDGKGKRYRVLWNEGRSDQVEEDLPRVAGGTKSPETAYSLRLKSREETPVEILVIYH